VIAAEEASMVVAYVAHPLGGGPDREANRARAAKWVAWITAHFGVATVADWIILSGQWSETLESRARGLAIDCALIERCDRMYLVGGRVSPGMQIEAEHARKFGKEVIDLTHLGDWPPLARP
jgi:hypothetical protein